MSIELIIFLVLWLVLTEIIFFRYARYICNSFIEAKLFSIFGSLVLSLFLFGLPALIAAEMRDAEIAKGYMAYVWYYGIISVVVLFFSVNYLIYKKVEKKEVK